MNSPFRFLALLVVLYLLTGWTAHAQERTFQKHDHTVFDNIEQAFLQGELTLDQKVLYKFYATKKPNQLPSQFQLEENQVIKCGTPPISDYQNNKSKLSSATIREVESMMDDNSIQASETYTSPSGNFSVHYETTGPHAVPSDDDNSNGIPDYVEEVAAAADSTYRHEVQTLGYTDPVLTGQTYNIYLINTIDVYNASYYGVTTIDGGTTYIEIENDFAEDFPPNDDPEGDQIGAIKVTVAHEFKHAVQYEANNWQGETGQWLEMDATLMEEVVYDNVNDYHNYLESELSIFSDPTQSFYPGSYYHVSWALYFEEQYGSQFWVNVWNIIQNNPHITMVDAMTQQLGGPHAFNEAYIESQLWHYASGPNSTSMYGFEESAEYPSPKITYNFVGDDSLAADTLSNLSAKYFDIQPSPFPGSIAFNFSDLVMPKAGFGIIAYFDNGSVEPLIFFNEQRETIGYETDWQWDEIDGLGIIAANGSPYQQTKYGAAIRSIAPNVVRVQQNYPNPFSEQTTIRYSIPKRRHVKLEVFDVLGRKVATLVDESRPQGVYPELFKADELASGIYFYRIIINGEVTTKKMTLIK